MSDLLLRGARVLDVVAGVYRDDHDVLVRAGRITAVGRGLAADEVPAVDLTGRTLLPGFIDCHVHLLAVTADLASLHTASPMYVAAQAAVLMREMLARGFTSVRDNAGADYGLAQAQADGLLPGPRVFFCGRALSQTGGHGDSRRRGQHTIDAHPGSPVMTRVVDGVDAIRQAAREELRNGAHHIKIMVSGGVASPTDEVDATQYSLEEIRAVVEEAEAAGKYVSAHAYPGSAISRAVRCGVRSIEHGNLLDEESLRLMVEHGTFLTPTLTTYWALKAEGPQWGLPPESHAKVDAVLDAGLDALRLAHRAGVKLCYGTDCLGGMQRHQLREFAIRAQVQPAIEVIRAATVNAAELLGRSGQLGVIAEGAHADLVVVDGDPLADISALIPADGKQPAVIQAGRVVSGRPSKVDSPIRPA
ncbi:MAG TPA: amidohydrolase family protein [Candidatus Limnocylindrales bacterium]